MLHLFSMTTAWGQMRGSIRSWSAAPSRSGDAVGQEGSVDVITSQVSNMEIDGVTPTAGDEEHTEEGIFTAEMFIPTASCSEASVLGMPQPHFFSGLE
jgi:hypothetical protein